MAKSQKKVLASQRVLEDYISYFETLSPRTIRLIEKLAAPGLQYNGPFFHLRGVDAAESMFENALAVVKTFRIRVIDKTWGVQGHTAYIKWICHMSAASGEHEINGISEISFNDKSLVIAHNDYWDSGEMLLSGSRLGEWLLRKKINAVVPQH